MSLIARKTLKELSRVNSHLAVSLYASQGGRAQSRPVHESELFIETAKHHLRKVCFEPEVRVVTDWMSAMLEQPALPEGVTNGIAVFAAKEFLQYYRLPLALPLVGHVGSVFTLLPFVRATLLPGHFYIISLHAHEVTLYRCDPYGVLQVQRIPAQDQLEGQAVTRERTSHSIGRSGAGRPRQITHGVHEEDEKAALYEYYHLVDGDIRKRLADDHAPIFLAGPPHESSIYGDVSRLLGLRDIGLRSIHADSELLQRRDIAYEALIEEQRELAMQALRAYFDQRHTGRAVSNLTEVLNLAGDGRVQHLFVRPDQEVFGAYSREQRAYRELPADDPRAIGLVNHAVRLALMTDAEVYALDPSEMPAPTVAAVLRY